MPTNHDSPSGTSVRHLHNTGVISSVDTVVVFGSQLLKAYYQDPFTEPYVAKIKDIFNQWKTETNVTTKALHNRIRECVEEQYENPGFHHVLTELAFLDIRKNHRGTSSDIVPFSLNNASMHDYLPLWGSSDLVVARDVQVTQTHQLHGLFFKLLRRIYTNPQVSNLIGRFDECYKAAVKEAETLKDPGQESLKRVVLTHVNKALRNDNKDQTASGRLERQKNKEKLGGDSKPQRDIPFQRNIHFVRRNDLQERLDAALQIKAERPEGHIRIALVGRGGCGKTQLAVETAYNSPQNYHVFWVNGSSEENFMTSYSKIALHLGQGSESMDNLQACLKVKDWLDSEESGAWRIFVDELDDWRSDSLQKLLHDILPVRRGAIILTSRDRSLKGGELLRNGFVLDASTMQEDDAKELVQRLAAAKDIPDLAITDDSKESASDTQEAQNESGEPRIPSDVEVLLKELEYLPLAIYQAVGYIGEKSKTIKRYLEILKGNDNFTFDSISEGVLQTWISSFQTIRRQSSNAWKILHTMSYLDHSGIAEDILIGHSNDSSVFSAGKTFDDAIGVLITYGLVSCQESSEVPLRRSYSLHQYTSLIANKWLANEDPTACREAFDLALSVITNCFTPYITSSFLYQPDTFNTCCEVLPHASSILRERSWLANITSSPLSEFKRWVLAFESGKLSFLRGNQQVAELRMAFCYDYCQKSGGPAERTIQTVIGLGMIKCDKGEYDEALMHYREAEAIIDANPTNEFCLALRSTVLLNQGKVYRDCGDYVKAESLYQLALDKISSTADPLLRRETELQISSCHANVLGTRTEALPEALAIFDRIILEWGRFNKGATNDQRVLNLEHGKASILARRGQFAEALTVFDKVILGTAANLGEKHRKTLLMRLDRAAALSDRGSLQDLQTAEEQLRQILDDQVLTLGLAETHSNVIATNHNLAVALARHAMALKQEERREEQSTTQDRGKQSGKSEEAISKRGEALNLINKVLGLWNDRRRDLQLVTENTGALPASYQDYHAALKTRADILRDQGNWEGAIEAYEELLGELQGHAHGQGKLDDKFLEAHVLLCQADIYLYHANDHDKARDCLDNERLEWVRKGTLEAGFLVKSFKELDNCARQRRSAGTYGWWSVSCLGTRKKDMG
ncbi:hypothetical protein QBC41DRAFT_370984 [Cercophora samala]|uniref:NB-ARC domain-containing protein n=1 Tax=Cercophora samala TaxID=330535 RepID=A0AA39ZK53_9PEZI|nr:hypothetical protein QBC41DRAFT_370984 [Cercophora samala]